MKLPVAALLTFLLLGLLAACKTTYPAPTLNTQSLNPATSVVNKGVYRIKEGDKLEIRNLNWSSALFPDPSQPSAEAEGFAVVVRRDGSISLPEIGRLQVAGLTRQDVADSLSVSYQDLRNPLFEVAITNLGVKVLGAVNGQGLVPMEGDYLTLGDVLARTGGIDYGEASNVIQIIRGEGTQQQVIQYDFRDLGDPLIMNQNIYDNDIVYVPPSRGSIRSVKYQRALVLAQPIITALNLTLIILNFTRLR